MKTGVAIATLLGCLAVGCMGSIVRINASVFLKAERVWVTVE
jgi:preprotein translocase subunit Sss1